MKLNLIEDRGVRFEMDIEDNKLMLDVAKVAESLRKDMQPKAWMNKKSVKEFLDLTCKQMGCRPDKLVHEVRKVDGSIELWFEAFVAIEYLRWANENLANWFAEKLNELISDGTISCD
jgi:hypothetical protein